MIGPLTFFVTADDVDDAAVVAGVTAAAFLSAASDAEWNLENTTSTKLSFQ